MFDAEPEEGSPASRLRNSRMRRGVYILPSVFTVGNLFCGYYAILATLRGNITDMDNAARAIGIAILFDALDGRVARITGTSSEFGKQFDSLADVISFGVAPAFLAFAWGVRGVLASEVPQARHVYEIGWLVSFVFVICCAWRLARFNIHGMAPGGSRFFVGMPTPAAAGMIAAMVHGVWWPIEDWRVALLWQLLVLALAALMSSSIRYYSFKDINWHRRQPSLTVVALALLIAAFWTYSEITLLLVAGSYTISGLVIQLVRVARHRHTASHPA
jgi:CDP-diacylglycerol--serine O-phosphatidyltransferase